MKGIHDQRQVLRPTINPLEERIVKLEAALVRVLKVSDKMKLPRIGDIAREGLRYDN